MKQKTIAIVGLTALGILLFAAGVWFGQLRTFGYGMGGAADMMNGRSGMMMNSHAGSMMHNSYRGMMPGNMNGNGLMYGQNSMMEMMHDYHRRDDMMAMMASMPDHVDSCPYHDQFFETEPENSE